MKLRQTRALNGDPATVIEVERPDDFDALLANIVQTRFYDLAYFETHSGYEAGRLVPNFWFIAEMAAALQPTRALEVGCGRGDVLRLLARRGVEVAGCDFSADVCGVAWPEIRDRVRLGELAPVCRRLAAAGERFDLLLGFDIWEHLLPAALDDALDALLSTGTDDALCFFVIPAFGDDPVFGEQFPLELEETRPEFEGRQPFRHLLAERVDPPVPASGHLIWAHTDWWQRALEAHGLVRVPALERTLHRYFDLVLPHSNRSFYLLRRDTPAAAARCARLLDAPYSGAAFLRCLTGFLRATYVAGEVRSGLVRHLAARHAPSWVRAGWRRLKAARR